MHSAQKPHSISQLLGKVEQIAGLTLGDLAAELGFKTPADLLKEKGWTGQLIEHALGASAGSLPEPDFPELGIELKTIPISYSGKPLETTYVSVAPLINVTGARFETSAVYKKLRHVLWLPILAERDIAPINRVIGNGFFWQPSPQQLQQLKQDWEELIEMIALGEVENITGHFGEVMQIRPKATNSKALTDAIGKNGQIIKTLPRGFYLKTHFTRQILAQQFSL